MKNALAILILVCGFSIGTFADWRDVASLSASSKQQEASVNQSISKVLIVCTDGSVTVERVSLVAGDKVVPFQMNSVISKGERQQITVGNNADCDKLLLVVSGQGRFEVKVRP